MESSFPLIQPCRTVCFTGHRTLPLRQLGRLRELTLQAVEECIHQGYTDFLCGGAKGFDMLAEECVLLLRERYPHIRLLLVLPCRGQERYWCQRLQLRYHRVVAAADQVLWLGEEYTRGCMHRRNRFLVEHSSRCLCYQHRESGGAAYTVAYAQRRGLEVENLWLTLAVSCILDQTRFPAGLPHRQVQPPKNRAKK